MASESNLDISFNSETHEYYCAIGSMCNPISLQLRKLSPVKSFPCSVPGWQLVFRGQGGMGSIEPDENACMHAVVHLMSKEDMIVLDGIELSYSRHPVTCHLYEQGITVQATAYIMDPKKMDLTKPSALPGERYLDIIARGCQHYGVQQHYIDWLKAQPCVPRRKPEDYRTFPIPEQTPIMHFSQLVGKDGSNDTDLLCAINGKVLKFVGDREQMVFRFAQKNYSGQDITCRIASYLYEPLYKPAFHRSDMSPEHCRFAEDILANWGANNWIVVGILPAEEASDNCGCGDSGDK